MDSMFIKMIDDELLAYNSHDVEKFCAFYHKEIIVSRIDGSIVARGIDELRNVYSNFFTKYPKVQCELKSRIVTDDTIIDEEIITGKSDYPNGQHAAVIYKFQDNLIHRVWFV